MEAEFVPYEQALELKELGFDEPCFAKYFQQDGNTPFIQIGESEIEEAESAGDDVTFECNAPLYQQVFKWFREKYKLPSWVYESLGEWYFKIVQNNYWIQHPKYFNSHEEAELECLKKLIEIVKEK